MSYFSRKNYGFTLVELLVSISIMTVILTVIVLNQSTYTDGVALANLADEIGLTMSQAQAYGIGVRELSLGSSDFSASYGLTFNLLDSGSSGAYLSFADRNSNQFYDGDWSCLIGGASECLERVNISRGNLIDSLCVIRVADTDLCNLGRIDVSFVRPSTEARILFFDNNGGPLFLSDSIGARIVLKSPGGLTRSVAVYETGQISVESSYTYPAPSTPTVNISASPNPVSYNSASILSWSSTDATSCSASGDWSGSKPLSGAESTSALTSNQTYTLTCTGPGGYDSKNVTITVGAPPAILTWSGTSNGSQRMIPGSMKYFTAGTYTVTVSANVSLSLGAAAAGGSGSSVCSAGGSYPNYGNGDGGGGGASTGSSLMSVTLYSGKSYQVLVGQGGASVSGGNSGLTGGETYLYNATNGSYISRLQGGSNPYAGGVYIGAGISGAQGGRGGWIYENGSPGGAQPSGAAGGGGSGGSCDWAIPGSGGTGGAGGAGVGGAGTSGGTGSVSCYNQTAGTGGGGWTTSDLPGYYGGGGGGGGACGSYGISGAGGNGILMFKAQ